MRGEQLTKVAGPKGDTMLFIKRMVLLALIASGLGSAACASEIDETGNSADNGAMHTAEPGIPETRVAVVIGDGVSDLGDPPRPPPLIYPGRYCIDLGSADASITGEELLERLAQEQGVSVVQAPGPLVCELSGIGCPADDCFCDPDNYWSYWNYDPSAADWVYAEQGHGLRVLRPGDMDGWSWLPLDAPWPDPDYALPRFSFEEVCPPRRQVFLPVVIR